MGVDPLPRRRYDPAACPCGGIGRRARLKIWWWQHRAGSIPARGTIRIADVPFAADSLRSRRHTKTRIGRDGFAAGRQVRVAAADCASAMERFRLRLRDDCSAAPRAAAGLAMPHARAAGTSGGGAGRYRGNRRVRQCAARRDRPRRSIARGRRGAPRPQATAGAQLGLLAERIRHRRRGRGAARPDGGRQRHLGRSPVRARTLRRGGGAHEAPAGRQPAHPALLPVVRRSRALPRLLAGRLVRARPRSPPGSAT